MHPVATLFFDVCVQRDLWPDGVWPLLGPDQARNVARLFCLAEDLGVRQGGIVCSHGIGGTNAPSALPVHCGAFDAAEQRADGCRPTLPLQVWRSNPTGASSLERDRATYVDSGCHLAPDDGPERERAFRHVTAGVRDAIVFGAGIEYGIDRTVDALLRHRIRTHVVLDAMGAADEILAQIIVADWKRRGVDGVTVEVVARLLSAAA
jgi:hypothetical protein